MTRMQAVEVNAMSRSLWRLYKLRLGWRVLSGTQTVCTCLAHVRRQSERSVRKVVRPAARFNHIILPRFPLSLLPSYALLTCAGRVVL